MAVNYVEESLKLYRQKKGRLNIILDKLENFCKPVSIFLYGSRARTDFLEKSDFEIGVLIPKRRYIGRSEIKKAVNEKGFNIYPFEYEGFVKGNIDTPFQKNIYLRELIIGGKTLRGKKVIENIELPQIRVIDIIQDLRFNLGYAFASMHSYRNADRKTASYEFYKSCLYGTRNFEILKLKKFPLSFSEIYELTKTLKLGGYKPLVSNAYNVRQEKAKLEEKYLFKNISYLNEFVEKSIIDYYRKNGDKILIE